MRAFKASQKFASQFWLSIFARRFLYHINFEFKTWYFKFQGLPGPGGKNGFPVYRTRDIKDETLTALLNPFFLLSAIFNLSSHSLTMRTIWFNVPFSLQTLSSTVSRLIGENCLPPSVFPSNPELLSSASCCCRQLLQ